MMINKNNNVRLCILLLCALVLADISPAGTEAKEKQESQIRTFSHLPARQNDGLIRYEYKDSDGNPLVFGSACDNPLSADCSEAGGSSALRSKKNAQLPSSYDSRESQTITPIRDQGITGSCWAFGALKAMESSSIIRGLSPLNKTDYSESHLAWYAYHPTTDTKSPIYGDFAISEGTDDDTYDLGGSAYLSLFTLAAQVGPVYEEEAPFQAGTAAELSDMISFMKKQPDSFRSQTRLRLREANCYDYADLDDIKQAIMQYGSLDVALYYESNLLYETKNVSSLYQTSHDDTEANHCVAIVGWDDAFRTFRDPHAPAGAWLVANSYGTSENMNGYFWVSYYDTSLSEYFSLEGEPSDTYDTLFQYDGFGWSEGYSDTDDIAFANVFTNDSEQPVSLEAASFYTIADHQDYSVQIYRNLKNNSPMNGEPVSRCNTSGTIERSGYHTVSLTEPIAVGPGETFSVIVTFPPNPYEGGTSYVAVEGTSSLSSGTSYASKKGQSYLYFASENTWYDTTAVTDEYGPSSNVNNVCVKALANTISPEEFAEQERTYVPELPASTPQHAAQAPAEPWNTAAAASSAPSAVSQTTPSPVASADTSGGQKLTISVQKASLTIGRKETVSAPVKISPATSSDKVRYTSKNTYVATINQSGKITGKHTGKTKITVSADSGTSIAVTVTVKKAPSSVELRAKKSEPQKKTILCLKKGRSAKLYVFLSKGSASYHRRFSSSAPSIVSVSRTGKIRARKKGRARITVHTFNGKKNSIEVRVR